MSTIQTISSEALLSDRIFLGSSVRTNYLWKNLIIEKRVSSNFIHKLYKNSLVHAFWSVLSSPVR